MPRLGVKKKIAGGVAAAGGAKKAASGPKKSKLYSMPEKIKEGTILKDLMKTEWKIGPSIGTGGFGEIYSASKKDENKYEYVVKCEPHDNGPLFVEMHFYMRNARIEDITKFQKEHGIKSLGMPYMIGNGSIDINGIKHRFIVMPRYGTDLAKQFLANGRKFPESACYRIALQMFDVYEFIHSSGYVHADLKAANILLGYGKQHQAYLVDFGLASHYTTKDFKPDPKKMHNGTIEYTSRDAHLGVATMRGDMEIFGYNLIEWLGVELPWVKDKILTTPLKVQKAKESFMLNVVGNLNKLFPNGAPLALTEFLKYVSKMEYNENPDYEKCRKIFALALKALKVPLTGELDLKLKQSTSINSKTLPSTKKAAKATTRKKIMKDISGIEDKNDSEEEIINASDDDDDDVIFINQKKPKKIIKKQTSKKLTPKQRVLANNSIKRTANDSHNLEFSPSPSKRSKLSTVKSPTRRKLSPMKQTTPLKTQTSPSKPRVNAKANIRMSPVVTMSSSRSGKTVINDRVTPNKKPSKTYEFNFELDVSMDANVIVNVKRNKKPLHPSQEQQNSLKNTPSEKHSSTTLNSSPVTKVKVRKVGTIEGSSNGLRTPVITMKKSRRNRHTPT